MPLQEMFTAESSNDIVVALPFVAAARAASAPALGRFGRLYGSSTVMHEVYRMIEKVAPTEATVFITGESGCGKELVARTIHERSPRAHGAFVAINCGAIPQNLIEAELFGHERGAFTGANRQHRGCFERAEGGTLFLDEITEMAPEMQVRLLRVLETGRFMRVGGDGEIRTNVRVLTATNRDALDAVRDGRLREDLMYRLAVFPIVLPPLREREGDTELLAEHFLQSLNVEGGASKRFSRAALTTIRAYHWPGNVRELKNAVHRAFIMAEDVVELDLAGLACPAVEGECLRVPVGTSLAEMERQAIFATLDHCRGNKRRAAEMLGVSLKTLYNRLTAYQAEGARLASM
ncbi:MAG TPA: sigma-54 dependent transcriptional regulator [Casimicrobiaceae bacterium]|nr:sigma-54 dependent transcriptional regulator [Casimicrobiaceae bacterium]